MGSNQVVPSTPHTSWLINVNPPNIDDPTAPSILDVYDLMATLPAGGYRVEWLSYPDEEHPGDLAYLLSLYKNGQAQQVFIGDYVVFDGENARRYDATEYEQIFSPA
jgi:hypothetical protein